jgi:hypothetical protein
MSNQIVHELGSLIVNDEQMREVSILRIEGDDGRFETRPSVCVG